MTEGCTEIYQEGLRIPPMRVMREGVLQENLFSFILLNMRFAEDRPADLRAQYTAAFRPNNSALLLVGDIVPDKAMALLETGFGGWRSQASSTPVKHPAVEPPAKRFAVVYHLRFVGQIATGHHERLLAFGEQQVMKRRVRQHETEGTLPRCDRGRNANRPSHP